MRDILNYFFLISVVILVLFILSPFELGFVVSDSMSPTIQPGSDMFIINTNTDSVDEFTTGDIVTFYSPVRETLMTHRVVDVTDQGLITKGDNSFETDQARGGPAVTDDTITGKIVEYSGNPIILPGGGTVSNLVNKYNNQILLSLLIILILQSLISTTSSNSRSRRIRPYGVILIFSVVLVVAWSGVIYVSSDTVSGPNYVVTEDVIESNPQFLRIGESTESVQTVNTSSSLIPTHSEYRALENAKVNDVEVRDGLSSIAYTIGPYDQQGVRTPVFAVYSYPKTLPESVITHLHNIHPIVASFATLSVVALPLLTLILLFVSNTPIRTNRYRLLKRILDD